MTNLEKYPNTADALKVYDAYHDGGGDKPFADWVRQEYVEPRGPTLLRAAEDVLEAWPISAPTGVLLSICIKRLRDAVDRERHKPVRNYDVYRTAQKAEKAHYDNCRRHISGCSDCPFSNLQDVSCEFAWLYAEAKKEAR